MNKLINNKAISMVVFILLPFIWFLMGLYLKDEKQYYIISGVDPAFCYLFNGLNLDHLALPWHIDHPGTPLQILSAIVIRTVHFFSGSGSLEKDIFCNPDLYLYAIVITIIALQSLTMFFCGVKVFKISQSVTTGLLFQLTPFVSYRIVTLVNRIMVEQLFVITVLCLIFVVFAYINEKTFKPRLIDKYVLFFSLIVGISMAVKITFFPIFFLPFILLTGIKKKVLYTIFVFVSFAVFAFPVFFNWVQFRDWIENLFVHSGQYGSGPANFVDVHSFYTGLRSMFSKEFFFPKIYALIIIACCLYPFSFAGVKEKNDKYFRALAGTALSMTLMIILVAKQYKYYYLVPSLLLMGLGIYLIVSIYSRRLKLIKKDIVVYPLFILLLLAIYQFELKKIFIEHSSNMKEQHEYFVTKNYIDKNWDDNTPTLIIADYFGAPYKEYGIFFGLYWCGEKMRIKYAPTSEQLFPNTYIYHVWSNMFNFWWDKYFSFIDLLKKYKNAVLFSGDPVMERSLFTKFHGINRQIDTKFIKVFFNENTNETIYKVTYDSIIANSIKKYTCSADLLDGTKSYFTNSYGQTFGDAVTHTSEKSKSGKFSSKLTKERRYGMTAILSEIKTNEHYRISVWKYNNNNPNAGIAISALDATKYFLFESNSTKKEGNWVKIEIDFNVPENLNNQDIKIFCWNNSSDMVAYFDDLSIEKVD
jgi:hypothetical protein